MDKNILLEEYNSRLEAKKEQLKEYGIFDTDSKSLLELNVLLVDAKEKLKQQGLTLKQMKINKENEAKALREKQLKQIREKDLEIQELETRLSTKEKMLTILQAEKNSVPKTIPTPQVEEELSQDPIETIICEPDEWGHKSWTRKKML